jgi:aminopeptidase N
LSIVEADFLDGMEFEGLFFLSKGFYNLYDGKPNSYLGAITVHETAHQWWYGQVGNDQAIEPWLDEAICTYSEALYFEANHPEGMDWWRQVRVNFYQPEGKVNQAAADFRGYIPYRNAVYLRGALFLEALRQRIGDDAFFGALQSLVAAHQYRGIITAGDFFSAVREQSPADIRDLMAEYFIPADAEPVPR